MAKKSSIEHAQHNERACNYLNKKPEYSDWTITVAFYSAMKYLEHKIFPIEVLVDGKAEKIENFDDYYTKEYFSKGSNKNKHSAFVELVDENLIEAAPSYRWLMDTSFTAR